MASLLQTPAHADRDHGAHVRLHGKVVTWDQALNAKARLMPAGLTFGPLPTPSVAVLGQTPLV